MVDQLKVGKRTEVKTPQDQPRPKESSDSQSIDLLGQLTELSKSEPRKRSARATSLKMLAEQLQHSEAKTV